MHRTKPWISLPALVVPLLLLASTSAFADGRNADTQRPDLPGDGDFIKDAGGSSGDSDLPPAKNRRGNGTGSGRGGDNVVVPEPGTIALLGLGLAGLGLAKRRRAKK